MSFAMRMVLVSLVGLVLLITLAVSLYVHRKQKRRFGRQLASEPVDKPASDKGIEVRGQYDDGVMGKARVVSTADAVMNGDGGTNRVPAENEEARSSLSGLGFNDMDAMFSDIGPSVPGQEEASHVPAQQQSASTLPEDIIVIYVMAKPGRQFIGYELLQALLGAGLRFGEMAIFHRHQQMSGQGSILFSLASATEPGTFDMNKMGAFSCQGLVLFMQLNGPERNLNALELMLTTAQQLADDLDGVVLDNQRQLLTQVMMDQFRKQVQARLTKF